MIFRKQISLLLVCAMIFTLAVPAYALEDTNSAGETTGSTQSTESTIATQSTETGSGNGQESSDGTDTSTDEESDSDSKTGSGDGQESSDGTDTGSGDQSDSGSETGSGNGQESSDDTDTGSGDQSDSGSETGSGDGQRSSEGTDTGSDEETDSNSETGSGDGQESSDDTDTGSGDQSDSGSETGSGDGQESSDGTDTGSGDQSDSGSETGSGDGQESSDGAEAGSDEESDSDSETGSDDDQESSDGTETDSGEDLSAEAQSFIDWANAISWDSDAAYDALSRYRNLTAEEMAAFEQIMGYLYGLKGQYEESYKAIYEAMTEEEKAAATDAYAAYSDVLLCINKFEEVAYQIEPTVEMPTDISAEPVYSYTNGSHGTVHVYSNLDSNGAEDGTYTFVFEASGSFRMYMVTSFGNVPSYAANTTRVVLPEGITSLIGYWANELSNVTTVIADEAYFKVDDGLLYSSDMTALYGCLYRESNSYVAPSTVTTVLNGALSQRDELVSVDFSNTNVKVLDGVCTSCPNLTEVKLPATLTSIQGAFNYCTSLEAISVPDSVTNMANAFSNCTKLKDVNVPSGVTNLDETFDNCTSLAGIDLPEDLACTELDTTFRNCKSLTSIYIPANIKTLHQSFEGCTLLSSVTFAEDSKLTSISSGFEDCTSLVTIELPSTVTYLLHAFNGCYNFTTLNWEDLVNLEEIGTSSFLGCSRLENPILPESLTKIGNSAFCKCSSITEITIPDTVTSIGKQSFQLCTKLEKVNISETSNLTKIGDKAFNQCDALTSIFIPKTVTSIGSLVFLDTISLTEIQVDEENTAYCDDNGVLYTEDQSLLICFPSSKNVSSYVVADGAALEQYAFHEAQYLSDLTLPTGLTEIPNYAFAYSKINTVNLEDLTSLTAIRDYAFYQCKNLDYVVVPDNVTSIANYAFSGLEDGRENIYLLCDDPALTIGSYAFKSAYGEEIYVINDNVKSKFKDGTYGGNCSHLEDVHVGYVVTVPAEITVDGDLDKVSIKGVSAEKFNFTIEETVTMTDTVGNQLPAVIDDYEAITFRWGNHGTDISVKWPEGGVPKIGTWTGNITYSAVPVE